MPTVPAPAAGLSPHEVEATRAFDQMHREMGRSAANEAELREKLNAILVNLSHRSQSLVERQLRLIGDLERGEQDASRRANLSKLNRIAMRMHRSSQNLLVVAGNQPSPGWNKPVTLAHLVEVALSEVEDCERVSAQVQPDIAVRGPAVHDPVHLLVELIENATSFSAADMPVHIKGHVLTTGGALVDITDRGIGMAARDGYANQQLDNPPPPDIDVPKWMGLLVVARLAARHGIRVRLNQADLGGLTALVWLPDEILTHYSAAADPGHPAAARRPGQFPGLCAARIDPGPPVAQPSPAWSARSPQARSNRAGRRARLSGPAAPTRRAGTLAWSCPRRSARGQCVGCPSSTRSSQAGPGHPRGIRSGRLGRGRPARPGCPGDRRPGLRPLAPFKACHLARRPGRVPRAATGRPARAAPARAGPRLPKRESWRTRRVLMRVTLRSTV